MRDYTKQYINGEWVKSNSNETIEVINPATEEVIGKVAKGNKADVDKAVEAADNVYLEFRHTSVKERQALLDKIVKESPTFTELGTSSNYALKFNPKNVKMGLIKSKVGAVMA